MDALEVFAPQHDRCHTPERDQLFGGLTDAPPRVRPHRLPSIVWLRWRLAPLRRAAVGLRQHLRGDLDGDGADAGALPYLQHGVHSGPGVVGAGRRSKHHQRGAGRRTGQ